VGLVWVVDATQRPHTGGRMEPEDGSPSQTPEVTTMEQTTRRLYPSAPGGVFDRYLCIAQAHQATLQQQAAAYRLARAVRRTSGRGRGARVAALLAAIGVPKALLKAA